MVQKKTPAEYLSMIRNFMIYVPGDRGSSEREICRNLKINRKTAHKYVLELEKSGQVIKKGRRLFWSDNLLVFKDQVMLRENFYDALRKLNLELSDMRKDYGFLYFKTRDGKDQIIMIPMAKEGRAMAIDEIVLASKIHEQGVTPEIQQEYRALFAKYGQVAHETRISLPKREEPR